MHFRYLGNSGFKISEITYGNWLTHGSQVENDQAKACVRAALDAGITTFDTADVYANTQAEVVLGEALGVGGRRRSTGRMWLDVVDVVDRRIAMRTARGAVEYAMSPEEPAPALAVVPPRTALQTLPWSLSTAACSLTLG